MIALTKEDVLELVPQSAPFRFLDEILEINPDGIKAVYTFRGDEFFYQGHFPGKPITPGVILQEACAQAGLVAFGLYLVSGEMDLEELKQTLTVFTEANVEFMGIVRPGDRITISARKVYFRRLKLKVEVECISDDGKILLRGTMAGMAVKNL